MIVRWEDDEFLMMLPDTDRDGTHRAAERLRRCISAAPFTVGAETVELTASVGWAGWLGEDPREFKLRVDRWLAREAGGEAGAGDAVTGATGVERRRASLATAR